MILKQLKNWKYCESSLLLKYVVLKLFWNARFWKIRFCLLTNSTKILRCRTCVQHFVLTYPSVWSLSRSHIFTQTHKRKFFSLSISGRISLASLANPIMNNRRRNNTATNNRPRHHNEPPVRATHYNQQCSFNNEEMTRRNCDVCFSNMTSLWRTTTRVWRGCVSGQSSRVAWLNSFRPTLHFNVILCISHRFHYFKL